jgi:hypothetical protein
MNFDCQNPTHISPSLAWKLTLFLSHPPAISNISESIQLICLLCQLLLPMCFLCIRVSHTTPTATTLHSTKAFLFIYLFLGWVVEARVWVREESNSPESGRTPELWVGARDGGWGGDDARYCVLVVLRFEIFMFKC